LASNGHFQFMKALYDLDQKSPEPFWDSIYYEPNNRPSKNIKFWLKHFAAKFGINSLMLYQRPAFYGMTPCLPRQPVPEFCQETPLIRAIQCSQIALVKFLLQEADLQTDVNKPDEFGITPLMHACMINSDKIVQLLFDPVAFQSQNDGAEQSDTANPDSQHNAGIGNLFSGFGSYGDIASQSVGDGTQADFAGSSDPLHQENKQKAVTRKFVLKTNLDPCRQSVISERLAFGGGKVKSFMHF
uniref:ANK_REP_REGION domain-containing protein n=1 Tax=Gongylonema pulchrum TaxID=637853 RepID=A0A183ERZ4_9BILA